MSAPQYIEPRSGETFPLDAPIWRAPNGYPLTVTPLPGIRRTDIRSDVRSLWRYAAALPVPIDNPVTMGEGCTPLVHADVDGAPCSMKLEWFSPTGSFKDRGAAVMVSFLRQQGVRAICEDSSGNGGAAIAGFGAAAGMDVEIFVPAHTQPAKIAQVRAYGAKIELVPGPREATEAAAIARADEIFYASHNWHPFFLQGTKTLGYEIWEDLGYRVPDNVVIPCGAGSNVLGVYMAFRELMASGEADRLPRIFVTQPANCAPVHASFTAGAEDCVEIDVHPTIAEGTAIRAPIRMPELLTALRDSGGATVTLSEDEIEAAALKLAARGIYVEPTCAHAAGGFAKLLAAGRIDPADSTVVVLTGTGLKATAFYAERFRQET